MKGNELKLFIPVVGTKIKLLKEAKVTIKNSSQNKKFVKLIEGTNGKILILSDRDTHLVLPKGLELQVDRVYIRKGDSSDFNSLTFSTNGDKSNRIPKGRFFVSVEDVNNFEVELVLDDNDKKETLARIINRKYRSYDYKFMRSKYEIIEIMLKDKKPVSTGIISMNLEIDLKNCVTEFDKILNDNGMENIESEIFMFRTSQTLGCDFYEDFRGELFDLKKIVTESIDIPVIKYSVFKENGEAVLHMEHLINSEACSHYFNAMNNFIKSINHVLVKLNVLAFFQCDSAYNALTYIDSRPKFGNKINRFNLPIYTKSERAYLLENGFSDTALFNSSSYAHYGFSYKLQNGTYSKPLKLRREWKALCEDK